MCKFSKLDQSRSSADWGDMFTFECRPPQTATAKRLREQLRNGTMPMRVATKRMAALDADAPYMSGDDYVADMAALTAVHWAEVDVKTRVRGQKLYMCLYNATMPERVELYLNNLRVRHSLRGAHRHLYTTGTKKVEALNFQCNQWFRQVRELHSTTLELQLRLFLYIGLRGHMSSLERPTSRIYTTDEIKSTWSGAFRLNDESWRGMHSASTPLTSRLTVLKTITKKPASWSWAYARKLAVPGWKRPAAAHQHRHRPVGDRTRVKLHELHPRSRRLASTAAGLTTDDSGK